MSEPAPELKVTSEPRPEGPSEPYLPTGASEVFTSTSEPKGEPEESSEPGSSVAAEPSPEWSTAFKEWGFAWEFYQYGLGTAFAVVAVLSLISIIRIRQTRQGYQQKKVHIVNFVLLTTFGISRALFLCLDAHRSKQALPKAVVNILWGIGQPCIITAYSLVFVVLKNALMLRQRFQNWYTSRNIALTTVPYFGIVFTVELSVSFVPKFKGLTLACQLLYVFFSLMLISFYMFVAVFLWKKLRQVTSEMAWTSKGKGSRLRSILLTCCAAVLGGTLLCGSHVYGMVGVYGIFSTTRFVPPWPWFAFNTVQRVLEMYMCVLLFCILSNKAVSSSGNREVTATVTAVEEVTRNCALPKTGDKKTAGNSTMLIEVSEISIGN